MSNSKRAKMTRVDLANLAAAWQRATLIERLAVSGAAGIESSPCHAADVCTMDPACPFVADCRAVEERVSDALIGDVTNWRPTGVQRMAGDAQP